MLDCFVSSYLSRTRGALLKTTIRVTSMKNENIKTLQVVSERMVALIPYSVEVGIPKATLWARMQKLHIKPAGSTPSVGSPKLTFLYRRSDLERAAAAPLRSKSKFKLRSHNPLWGKEHGISQAEQDADMKLFYEQRNQRNQRDAALYLSAYN